MSKPIVIWSGKVPSRLESARLVMTPATNDSTARVTIEVEVLNALKEPSWISAHLLGGDAYAFSILAAAAIELAGHVVMLPTEATKPS